MQQLRFLPLIFKETSNQHENSHCYTTFTCLSATFMRNRLLERRSGHMPYDSFEAPFQFVHPNSLFSSSPYVHLFFFFFPNFLLVISNVTKQLCESMCIASKHKLIIFLLALVTYLFSNNINRGRKKKRRNTFQSNSMFSVFNAGKTFLVVRQ